MALLGVQFGQQVILVEITERSSSFELVRTATKFGSVVDWGHALIFEIAGAPDLFRKLTGIMGHGRNAYI